MVRVDYLFITVALLAGSASATPVSDQQQIAARAALESALDQMAAELLKPGEVRPGWEKGGVDIYQALESAPGGLGGNYLLSTDKDGERSITVVQPGAPADFLPDSWKLVVRSGAQQIPTANVTILNLEGPYFVVGWETSRRVADAFCSSGGIGGELHRSSDTRPDSEIPQYLLPALLNGTVKRFKDTRICWRFDRKGDDYAVTYFLEDGRALPTMNDAEEMVTIVPAQPVEGLLGKKTDQD
jgi:hypothetical protein